MATYYWVGGSGNWDATSTTNWASSSNGPGGAGVPTSVDDVIFDANSNGTGTGAFTVTITGTSTAPAVCRDFSTGGGGGALDGVMTISQGATSVLDVYGSMTLPATNLTWSGTSGNRIRFRATTTGKTITTNGVTIGGGTNTQLEFTGSGGEWTLGSALTLTGSVILTQGTFRTANFNVTTGINFLHTPSIGTQLTRAVYLGSSTISTTGTFGASGSGTLTNITFDAGTSSILLPNNNGVFLGGGLTYYNVTFTGTGGGTLNIAGNNTFNNLTFTSMSVTGIKNTLIAGNQTITGTLTVGSANTLIRRMSLRSDLTGITRTINAANITTLAYIDFRDITNPNTTWSGLGFGDCGGNSGITFGAPKTVYRVGTGNWSATQWKLSGGSVDANNFPLPQDTVIFDTGTTTGTHTIDSGWNIGPLDMSSVNVAVTLATGTVTPSFHGNVTLDADVTLSGTGTLFFTGQANQTLISAGKTFTQPITVNKPTTTSLLLGDALTTLSQIGLIQGILDLNGYDLTCSRVDSNITNTRSIAFGSNKIVVTGNAQTVIEIRELGNFTFTGTPTFDLTYSGSTGTRTIRYGTTSGGTELKSINLNITSGTDTIEPGNSYVLNLNFTGFSGILTNISAGNCTIYGNTTISSGMTIASTTAGYTFAKSSGTQTLVSAGKTFDCPITKQGAGTLTLNDALTIGTTRTFTLTEGTLDLNGFDLTCGLFSSAISNTRSIAFGSKAINVTGNNANIFTMGLATNFTYTGTPNVNFTYSGEIGTRTILFGATAGATETNAINFNVTAGTDIIATTSVTNTTFIKNFDFTGFAGTLNNNPRVIYGNLTLSSSMTLNSGSQSTSFSATTGAQTITTNGKTLDFPITKSGAGTFTLADNLTIGSTRTFTLTQGTLDLNGYDLSCGVFSSDNSNTRSINFGAKRIYVADTRESGAQIIAMSTMTNFNYTGSGIFNVNNSGSGTKRCAVGVTAGGTESNAISIECSTGTGILKTFGHFKDINLTGYSGQYDLQEIGGTLNKFIYGDMTISSTTTVLGGSTNNLTFQKSSGTQTLVSAGKTFDCPVVKSAAGTLQLSDNLTMGSTRTFTLTQGTLNVDGKTLSTGLFSSSNSNARTINLGTNGKITVTGSGTAWNTATATNLTELGTGTIDMTSPSAKTFAGGSSVFPYTLNQGGSGTLTITGSNQFADITDTIQPSTITFTAGTTTTVNAFSLSGIAGNVLTINSSSPGTRASLTKSSGTIDVSYCRIQDIDASGVSSFTAFNSVDLGNNSGINFIKVAAARLSNDGILYTDVSSQFDEVTQSSISISPTALYAEEFDEVSLPNSGVASFKNNSAIVVDNILDEITGIL